MPNAQEVLEWMEWDKERKANMTNEEWLKQCTTKQLAEWMVMLQLVGVYPIKRGSVDTEMFIADTVEWLKQPHKEKRE